MSNHPNRSASRNVRLSRRELEAAGEALACRLAGPIDTEIPHRSYEGAQIKISNALREIENAHG